MDASTVIGEQLRQAIAEWSPEPSRCAAASPRSRERKPRQTGRRSPLGCIDIQRYFLGMSKTITSRPSRYELTQSQWERIEDLLPGKA
ncbi:hypothetical protein, partial [uncultured Xanthomonas sp.]|uniref:hypothetical protein n=1 Tax=uncultured Xanthomonas sp. TaxID=152831 RepID=UPI0025EC22D7